MRAKQRICIAGGGIAGLTLSLFLNPELFEVVIFEQNKEFSEIGAAISVFPNALSVLKEAGILNEVLSSAGELKQSTLKTWEGKTLVNSNLSSEFPIICMHRKDLHEILVRHSNAQLVSGKKIIGFENQIHDVQVYFSDGSHEYFDLLIGADGLHSAVRGQIINDGEAIYRGSNIWRGVVKSTFDVGYASETWGIGKRVGIVPIREGYYGWWATIAENQHTTDDPNAKEKLIAAFNDWHHPIPELIASTDTIIKNSLVDRKLVTGWSQGRAVLLGDAAHPTTPNLGQGGCMAMEGAIILARCLEKYGISKAALDRYESIHYPRAKQIVEGSLRFGNLADYKNPLMVGIRNTLFKITPASIAQKMFDVYFNYRAASIEV